MDQKELKIDVAAVAGQASRERQPGEDLDEALLRSCKKLYGETGAIAFQAVQSTVAALAERTGGDREKALQQIAEGKASVRVVTRTQITQKDSTGSLNDLPPEMRAEVAKALASGKAGSIVITKPPSGQSASVSSAAGSRDLTATNRCLNCGFEFPSDIASCPQCGKEVKRSFWARLFGK